MGLRQAVILAGGMGERLRPLTDTVPKPMVSINGRPFLDYLIGSLKKQGISKFLFLVGYKADQIIGRYRSLPQVVTEFSIGKETDQTGRRLLDSERFLDAEFIVVFGDTYLPLKPDHIHALSVRRSSACMTLFSNKFGTGEYGRQNNVECDDSGYVLKYDKTRSSPNLNSLDIGYCYLKKDALDFSVDDNLDFGDGILGKLIKTQQVKGFTTDTQYFFLTDLDSVSLFADAARNLNFQCLDHTDFSADVNWSERR